MQKSNNLSRDELRKKLKNKIADKQNSRNIGVNRKKTSELHEKLKSIMAILSENQQTSNPLENADNITPDIIDKINKIITKEDYNALLNKIINNNEMYNLLKSIQNKIINNQIDKN